MVYALTVWLKLPILIAFLASMVLTFFMAMSVERVFLRRLIETQEETQGDVIFVLAVDLERRKVFQERDIELLDDGGKNRIYEHKATGEVFIIRDPDLDLRELEDVQGRVLELLLGK